jgi:integrase
MPVQANKTLTLRELANGITVNENLSEQALSEIKSAVSTFARVCGRDASEIVADPGAIRALAKTAPWQIANLSKGSWANTLSRVTRGLALAGIAVHRRRRNFKLAPEWEVLFEPLERRERGELHRFAGWCTIRGVYPADVTAAIFDEYLSYLLAQSILHNPRERWNVARRAWNRAIAAPGSAYPVIPSNEPPGWRGLRWEDFPPSLAAEIAAYRKKIATKSLFDKSAKPLAQVTIDGYLRNIRVAASRLVEDGVPIGDLASLAAIIEPAMIQRALQAHLGDRPLKDALPGLQAIAIAALSVAKFADVPTEKHGALKAIFKEVQHRQTGMTKKNRDRLAQFDDQRVLHRLLELPSKIDNKYKGIKKPSVQEARRMQHAVALEVLLHVPMRVKNLAALDLEAHVNRPLAGKTGNWRISIPEDEVKNDNPIDAELNPATSRMLARYVSVFRPVLKPGKSAALFLSQDGGTKGPSPLSQQFAKFIKRELGVTVNAHLMRHLAAFIYLEQKPGDYETVRRLLGHKQITTTVSIYAGGAESKNAWARFDNVIEGRRSKGTTGTKSVGHDVDIEDLDSWEEL